MFPMTSCVNTDRGHLHGTLQQDHRPDWALGRSWDLDATMAPVATQDTQMGMARTAAWPLETNMMISEG